MSVNPGMVKRITRLVSQAHAAGGFSAQINPNAEEVRGASCFASLAAYTIFGARGGCNLSSLTAIPGNHFQNVGRASPDALGASNAGVIDFDGMRH
jgi:hypothetical protein